MQPTALAQYLPAFLTQYLPAQRNASPHTITAYRDTCKLLLRFCRDHRGIPPHQLPVAQRDVPCRLALLESAATERPWPTRTRNQRLAALHAFWRSLQPEAPDYLLPWQQILALPSHKDAPPVVGYLAPEAVAAILQQPDLTTRTGRRDAVLLSLLYDTGARGQELIARSPRAVRLASPAHVQLTGNGRQRRMVPRMASTVALLQTYMQEQG
jgi:integrase/recombinase XerD